MPARWAAARSSVRVSAWNNIRSISKVSGSSSGARVAVRRRSAPAIKRAWESFRRGQPDESHSPATVAQRQQQSHNAVNGFTKHPDRNRLAIEQVNPCSPALPLRWVSGANQQIQRRESVATSTSIDQAHNLIFQMGSFIVGAYHSSRQTCLSQAWVQCVSIIINQDQQASIETQALVDFCP